MNRFVLGIIVAASLLAAIVAPVDVRPADAVAGPVNDGRFPTEESFVDQAYRDILSRGPDAGGLQFWAERMRAGQAPEVLVEDLILSPEFDGTIAPIFRLYRSVFDRRPDSGGLNFWIERFRSGQTLPAIADQFLEGAEFAELAAAQNTEEVVAAIYGRSLGRAPDPDGLAFWTNEIESGRLSLGAFVATVSESPEHRSLTNGEVVTTLIFLGLLKRLPEPAGLQYWIGEVDAGLPLRSFAATVMALPEYQNRFATPPTILTDVVAEGLTIPWDIESLPDGSLLVTERPGGLVLIDSSGVTTQLAADFSDVFANSETGVMGLAVDPDFANNRRFYTCQGHNNPREIQVIAWTLAANDTSATRVADPLVGGLPIGSGRHGGCQLEFDDANHLFIGTGDSAVGSHPQDLASLGGKVLRVDAATGGPIADNPFADSDNEASQLIYTYGHRNVQGLSPRPTTGEMWSVEHGPSVDDEVNLLVSGANAGWNPVPGYNESVSMTNSLLANADSAEWSTGSPTLALSGGEWFDHEAWGSLNGGLAVAALKTQTLRLLFFNEENLYLGQRTILDGEFGRLRAVHQGSDGSIYVSTSTGSDSIIKLTPR